MALQTNIDPEVRLLPPLLPALLVQRSRSSYIVKPRAGDNTSATTPGSSSSASNPSSPAGQGSSVSAPNHSTNHVIKCLRNPVRCNARWSSGGGSGGNLGGRNKAKSLALWPLFTGLPKAPSNDKPSKRILIMMSNTGGGHKASAEAIKAAFQEKYGNEYEIIIEDMWKDHTPAPFNKMPDTYSFMVKHSLLWKFCYEMIQPRAIHIPYLNTVGLFISRKIAEAFDTFKPDLAVSVHPLMQHIPVKVMRSRIRSGVQPPTNFATVVTDFTTCHNTWFDPGVTRCFVATDYCAALAKRQGLSPQQIVLHGLPIRPAFSKKLPPRLRMKKLLGLEPSLPAVLLVGGGEGMGKLEATVDQMAVKLGSSAQVVVICGRNRKLLTTLRSKNYDSGMRVVACGFVDNIHEWMAACDLIVTKAGPGSMAEALISGLPILLNGNVPGQEEGNIPYVIENKVGAFETNPAKIADIVQQWLGPDRAEFDAMAARAKALGRPEAVYKIVEDLAQLTLEPDFNFGPAKAALKPKGRFAFMRRRGRGGKCCSKTSQATGNAAPAAA